MLWAHSNPKWPVEWVANWFIIPPSASTRGQNRPPTPPLGGGGPHSISFRATGRLYTTTHCKSEFPCHEHWLAIKTQTPNGHWRGSLIGRKCPNRHELKGKTVPQHPPWGPKHPHPMQYFLTYRVHKLVLALGYCSTASGYCSTVPRQGSHSGPKTEFPQKPTISTVNPNGCGLERTARTWDRRHRWDRFRLSG